jgi:hypothetical protein
MILVLLKPTYWGLFLADFLLGLLFDLEDEGSMFLLNMRRLYRTSWRYIRKDNHRLWLPWFHNVCYALPCVIRCRSLLSYPATFKYKKLIRIRRDILFSVPTAKRWEGGAWRRFLAVTRQLSLLHCVHTAAEGHQSSYIIGTAGCLPKNQAQGAWNWPLSAPSSAEVRSGGSIPWLPHTLL